MPLRRDTRVFISAVSKELGTVRKLVKKALEDSGYHAVEQDNFPLDYRALIDKLRLQIESCDAVIHIAGRCYGAEPRERPAEAPRRSYTQLEYDLARELGKPIYVFVTGEGFPADDYPVEDEEQLRLQEAHRQALTDGRQDYLRAATREEINDKVRSLQLRIEKAQEELEQVDEKVAATGRHLGRRLAWVLAGVLAVIATLGISRLERGKTTSGGADRRIGANPDRRALSRPAPRKQRDIRRGGAPPGAGRASGGCGAVGRGDSTDHRQEDRPARARRRAIPPGARQGRAGRGRLRCRVRGGREATRRESRAGDPGRHGGPGPLPRRPAAGLEREGPRGLPARPCPLRRRRPTPGLGPRRALGSLRAHGHGALRRGRTPAAPGRDASRGKARSG